MVGAFLSLRTPVAFALWLLRVSYLYFIAKGVHVVALRCWQTEEAVLSQNGSAFALSEVLLHGFTAAVWLRP